MRFRTVFIIYLLILGLVAAVHIDTGFRGEQVLQTRIVSVAIETRDVSGSATYQGVPAFILTGEAEYWNSHPSSVASQFGADCGNSLRVIPQLIRNDAEYSELGDICQDYSGERSYESGLALFTVWRYFFIANLDSSCLPEGNLRISAVLVGGVDQAHKSTIQIKNCEWSLFHDPLPDNWGEINHYLRNTFWTGVFALVIYMIGYEVRGRFRVRGIAKTSNEDDVHKAGRQRSIGLSPSELEKL